VSDDIDRAIDDVARDLTTGDTGRDFRARVLARIEAGKTATRRWPAAWLLAPLTVAAAIVVFVFVARESPPRVRGPETSVQRGATGRPTLDDADVRLTPDTTQARRATVRLPRAARGASVAGRPRSNRESEIDSLAPPPLDVPSIALAPIGRGESIQLQQLEPLAPINVAPLTIEEGVRP
jgi:hypothetical protein